MFSVTPDNRADYYRYLARLNYEAALAADDVVGHIPGYESAAPPPVMVLCAHCIELSLKAFLLKQGMSERRVRSANHDLVAAWKLCVEYGAEPDLLDRGTLSLMADLLKSGRLRYGESSSLGAAPAFGPLQEICEACLTLCRAPSWEDIV